MRVAECVCVDGLDGGVLVRRHRAVFLEDVGVSARGGDAAEGGAPAWDGTFEEEISGCYGCRLDREGLHTVRC